MKNKQENFRVVRARKVKTGGASESPRCQGGGFFRWRVQEILYNKALSHCYAETKAFQPEKTAGSKAPRQNEFDCVCEHVCALVCEKVTSLGHWSWSPVLCAGLRTCALCTAGKCWVRLGSQGLERKWGPGREALGFGGILTRSCRGLDAGSEEKRGFRINS